MQTESIQWQSDVMRWQRELAAMRAWHEQHPARDESPRAPAVRSHQQACADHEHHVATFEQDLDRHGERIEQGTGDPERESGDPARSAVLGDEMTLRTTYRALAVAHEQLVAEHVRIMREEG